MMPDTQRKPIRIRPAATVAVLADRQGLLHVLLLRRAASHVFAASADVYPGGALEDNDHAAAVNHEPDRAWRVAALREAFEEAGLVLTANRAPGVGAARVAELREALAAGHLAWDAVQTALGVVTDPTALVAFAEWTTPPGAPKRYATSFYAVAAPPDQQASADGHETVAAAWLRPAQALAEAERGQRGLLPPTRATLARLATFRDTATALAGLSEPALATL